MYQIEWADTARAELRAIWNAAPASDNQLLIWAVADIAFRLERDPENEGESRIQGMRVMSSRPLWVLYHNPDGDPF